MRNPEHTEWQKAIDKAADAIQTARYDLQGGYISAVANRTYYACYYCMTALLYSQNTYAKTHQGTRAKFSEFFIKTSIFPPESSAAITMLFDYRQEADYDLDSEISFDEASDLINKAEEIYKLTVAYFQTLSEQDQ